ncbi:HTH_Tnp_Tc3_2 domain-containing protein [Trichonephila clavipes]|nr:HTH_Tnp_Tc3_2 domain-containing protein [Trichonephila clavipes]
MERPLLERESPDWRRGRKQRGVAIVIAPEASEMQLPEFERGRIIGLKKAGWEKRRITHHMGRSDAAIRKCLQEWVANGRFQRLVCSGRPRATADWVVRVIVRSAVTARYSSSSTIRSATCI